MPNAVKITYGRTVVINDAGIVDDNAIRAFTYGQCHALALAIRKLSGLPLVGIWRDYDRDKDEPAHIAVLLPNGELLDIQGLDVESRWPVRKIKRVSESKVKGYEYYVEPNLKAAEPFAKTLIKKYSKEINEANKQVGTSRSEEALPQATT